MYITQGYNMNTDITIGIIAIATLQLIYIFFQHIIYTKQLNELKMNMMSIDTQLKDKSLVINELQEYINKTNN